MSKEKYEVVRTRCNCHAETCCCDPWTILADGKFFTRVFSKKAAEKIAEGMNAAEVALRAG